MDTITAILTVWKRNHLEEQILSLLKQTVPPNVIWIQQSQHHVDVESIIRKYRDQIRYTCWEHNPGIFGRFESVKDVETTHVYVLDDDIIPAPGFLKKALETSCRWHAIVSPHGRILDKWNNRTAQFVGDGYEFQHSFCTVDKVVDFGNNSWFFRKEWIDFFLKEKPLFRTNGEDIHLSATCKIYGTIQTIVPKQIRIFDSGNIKRVYSSDEFALHRKPKFNLERAYLVKKFRELGWELQQEKNI